ncbi:glycine radical domain-containing protein, partial [Staphylococcus epidermidis]|uniref:glycine radical domain-containing protein n=1 Tax=Staphylococcus epidermidis TaxID=1282 RepID=UPI0028CB8DE0
LLYPKKTPNTPHAPKPPQPFPPPPNPIHGRHQKGPLSSLTSVPKIPYHSSKHPISNTFTILPKSLRKEQPHQNKNLTTIL